MESLVYRVYHYSNLVPCRTRRCSCCDVAENVHRQSSDCQTIQNQRSYDVPLMRKEISKASGAKVLHGMQEENVYPQTKRKQIEVIGGKHHEIR